MTGASQSYIQINIYGKKLCELQQDGIDAACLIRGFGCDKFWIGEVPLMNSDSDSGLDSSGEEEDVEVMETTVMADKTALLSSTVADVKFPPCSTPIISKRWPSFNMIPSRISNIYGIDFNVKDDYLNLDIPESGEFEDVAREVLESIVQRLERDIYDAAEAPRFELPPTMVSSKTEFRSSSECPRTKRSRSSKRLNLGTGRKLAGLKTIKRESTVLLNSSDEPRGYHQLRNTQFYDEFQFTNESAQLREHFSSFYESAVVDHTFEFNDYDAYDARTENRMDEEEETASPHQPVSTVSKKVSFAVPETRHEKKMNKAHTVKCHFEGCTKSFTWKPKYGKTRLVDHAFTHVSGQEFKCALCEFTCRTIRSIRYHHKHKHHDAQLTGFGIRSILKTSKNDSDLVTVWGKCYRDKLRLLENKTINMFTMQKKTRDEEADAEQMRGEAVGEEEPTFRIR